jgi:hypothetical protein
VYQPDVAQEHIYDVRLAYGILLIYKYDNCGNAIAVLLVASYKALTRSAVANAQVLVVTSFPNVLP